MEIQDFKEVNIRIAEDQPEFQTVPALHNPKEGSITYCFRLTQADLERIKKEPFIYFKQYTGNKAMQPIYPTTLKEEVI